MLFYTYILLIEQRGSSTQPSYTPLDPCMLWAQLFLEIRGVTPRSYILRSGTKSLVSQYYVMAHGIHPLGPSVCVLVGSRPVELPFASLFQVLSGIYIDVVSFF